MNNHIWVIGIYDRKSEKWCPYFGRVFATRKEAREVCKQFNIENHSHFTFRKYLLEQEWMREEKITKIDPYNRRLSDFFIF